MAVSFGCDDPSVSIRFTMPELDCEEAEVSSLALRVLLPPAEEDETETFDCNDVALGHVTAETLDTHTVLELTGDPGGFDLSGIPRLGTKLLVVEARAEGEEPLAAGCASVGEISGNQPADVPGEPVKVAGFLGDMDNGFPALGGPLPDSVTIAVTDICGNQLSGVPVDWRIIGLAGAEVDSGSEPTAMRGLARLTLAGASEIPGPALLDASVRWERTPAPMVGGFGSLGDAVTVDLFDSASSIVGDPAGMQTEDLYAVGRIGPNGEMGIIALGPNRDTTPRGRPIRVGYFNPDNGGFEDFVASQNILSSRVAVATVTRSDREIPVVATEGGLIELQVSESDVTLGPERALPGVPHAMVPAGPCQGDSDVLLVVLDEGVEDLVFRTVSSAGMTVASPFSDSLPDRARDVFASGCTSVLVNELSRTIVYHTPFGNEVARQTIVVEAEERRSTPWTNFARTPGFTPVIGDQTANILGVSLDIDGTSLSRFRPSLSVGPLLELEEVTDDELFTFALAMQGGDFDGDDLVDIAILMDFGEDDQQRRQVALQIVLGAEYLGQRIVGVTDESEFRDPSDRGFRDPFLFVADFNGDGADDIVVAERNFFVLLPGSDG